MGGVEELQPAELHEGHIAPGKLDLKLARMAGGAEQHRLFLQPHALLAVPEHLVDEEARLIGLGLQGDEARLLRRDPVGPERLGEALARLFDHPVGGGEDGLWVER